MEVEAGLQGALASWPKDPDMPQGARALVEAHV
jgi:hypothetical protein